MVGRRTVILAAIATGAALELGVEVLTGRREAWDSALYWTVGMPLAALAAGVIGYLSRRPDWLWTAAIVPAQVTTMMIRSREIGPLWPLALVLSSILSAPFVACAFAGTRLRRSGRPDAVL
jgi:hypothetical protein